MPPARARLAASVAVPPSMRRASTLAARLPSAPETSAPVSGKHGGPAGQRLAELQPRDPHVLRRERQQCAVAATTAGKMRLAQEREMRCASIASSDRLPTMSALVWMSTVRPSISANGPSASDEHDLVGAEREWQPAGEGVDRDRDAAAGTGTLDHAGDERAAGRRRQAHQRQREQRHERQQRKAERSATLCLFCVSP